MTHHHDYMVIKTTEAGTVEVCTECKHKLVTKTDKKGRMNNREYLKSHVRDTAQPTGTTEKIFRKYYDTK